MTETGTNLMCANEKNFLDCAVLSLAVFFFCIVLATPVNAHAAFNVGRGIEALERGDLEMAETELQKARFASPDAPEIQYNLGIVNYRKRDYSLAARYFAGAANLSGDAAGRFAGLYNLGNASFKAGDYATAVAAYESSLEIKEDEHARFNLQVAREKLRRQIEKQQQSQKPEGKSDEKNSESRNENESQNQSQEKSGQQSGQNEQSAQNDQQSGQNDQRPGGDKPEGNDSKNTSDQEKSDSEQSQSDNPQSNDSARPDSKTGEGGENASQSQELNLEDETTAEQRHGTDENSETQATTAAQEKDVPEASQRARAMKNSKVNPYMVEKVLKEMERRERDAQLRYRNEDTTTDEIDPFDMDADQLREWFENRRRPAKAAPENEPDW